MLVSFFVICVQYFSRIQIRFFTSAGHVEYRSGSAALDLMSWSKRGTSFLIVQEFLILFSSQWLLKTLKLIIFACLFLRMF